MQTELLEAVSTELQHGEEARAGQLPLLVCRGLAPESLAGTNVEG